MKNRRRRAAALGSVIQPAPFDHDLFRHLFVSGEGVDVVDLACSCMERRSTKVVQELLSEYLTSKRYVDDHPTNEALLHLQEGASASTTLREVESNEPHIWLVTQEDQIRPCGYSLTSPAHFFSFLREKKWRTPGRRQRSVPAVVPGGASEAPLTRWLDIQTGRNTRVVEDILARFPVDLETEEQCLYLGGQDSINTLHMSKSADRAYLFVNLMCTPTVTQQTVKLCHGGPKCSGQCTVDDDASQFVSHDALYRGKSVMEMRFNALRDNIPRSTVPDPVPVALIVFPEWVITIHEKPFAEMDDLLRMIQLYCSPEKDHFVSSFSVLTRQRFTSALFLTTFLRIAVGHNIDSVALAEEVDELGDMVFDVPSSVKEQEKVIRRITDIRRCFGECGTDVDRREKIVDTLLDTEMENNFIIASAVTKEALVTLQSHLRAVQRELADYRDTVAASHWYHNVAVQRTILIRGNSDLRMILLLTEMCNIMYPVMLLQTLYSINVVVPFDSEGDPPSTSYGPFFFTAGVFALYIFLFGRTVFAVFRRKVFTSQYIA